MCHCECMTHDPVFRSFSSFGLRAIGTLITTVQAGMNFSQSDSEHSSMCSCWYADCQTKTLGRKLLEIHILNSLGNDK